MVEVIERPPAVGAPPQLPPSLRRRRGGPERRTIILPNLFRAESATKIRDLENNWITIIYQWMDRVTGESVFDLAATWECAHISTRRYRQWLETYQHENGIPPHIGFGGAIMSGEGDPTFYPRWQAYARETFV